MAAELDPLFVRALYLLHSRHPKSLEQLCALRDEALGKKPETYIEIKKEEIDLEQVELEKPNKHSSTPGSSTDLSRLDQGETKKLKDYTDSSMQHLLDDEDEDDSITETVEVDSSSMTNVNDYQEDEMIETVEEFGSSFLETVEEITSSSLLLSKRKKAKMDAASTMKSVMEEVDLPSRESSPDHEITADLGIHCIICMSGKTSVVGNQLVECHECHEHYHQNCHKPNITDQSVNDPRHVWYCSSCFKRMKEATSATTTLALATKLRSLITSNLPLKSPTQSFKSPVRMDGKPPSFSPSSSSVNQSFIMPSLTGTNTSSSGSSSSSSTGGLKSPSNAYPRDVTRNSMKRLQMVKKKAAAKNQQRFNKR